MESSGGGRDRSQSRTAKRADPDSAFGTIEEESIDDDDERPELFSMMQNLLHSDAPDAVPGVPVQNEPTTDGATGVPMQEVPPGQQQYMIPARMVPTGFEPAEGSQPPAGAMQPFQPLAGQTVETVDQAKLMEILSNIQERLAAAPLAVPGTTGEPAEKMDITQSLGEILQAVSQDENVISAVDRQSSDVINLVTLLYEAIWQDPSVPIPIKELIGRTQVTIIKVALADVNFFNDENHPARAILNEYAYAGIGWTEVESLEKDPLYQKIYQQVELILNSYNDDITFFDGLISDFKAFRARDVTQTSELEQNILKADERKERIDDIHELVSQEIEERVLGRELDPFVEGLLQGDFYKFMVMLVIKEGPGSNAWKQAINTIDVLLWSIEEKEQQEDRGRLETITPSLFNNLRKALRIASVEPEQVDEIMAKLARVQEESLPAQAATPEPEPNFDEAEPLPLNDVASELEFSEAEPTEQAPERDEAKEAAEGLGIKFLAAGEFEQKLEQEANLANDADAAQEPSLEDELATISLDLPDGDESEIEIDIPDIDQQEVEPDVTAPDDDLSAEAEESELSEAEGPESETDPEESEPEPEVVIVVDEDLDDNSPFMQQVADLNVGMWVEFAAKMKIVEHTANSLQKSQPSTNIFLLIARVSKWSRKKWG